MLSQVVGTMWFAFNHRRLWTSGLTYIARVGSGPSVKAGCGGGLRGSSVSLNNVVPLDNVAPARVQCLLFWSWPGWSTLRS